MNSNRNEELNDQDDLPMCSICRNEPPLNAVQLECGHIFCYMCIKSAAETTGVCALCRAEIGIEFNFRAHDLLGTVKIPTSTNGYYWFYEGYKGWWLYEAETNRDLEKAFEQGERQIERFIAGYQYKINLVDMYQQRSDGEGRIRKICRNTLNLDNIIGMGGLKGGDFEEILEMMRSSLSRM